MKHAPETSDDSSRRLRVLMVTPRYFPLVGGVEHHVAQVARRMSREADVTVLTADRTGELPESETIDDVNVVRVRAWPRNRDYYFAFGVRRVIADGDWDLIHIQSVHTAVAPIAMIAALRAGVPYVLTFHGGGHSSALREALRGMQWRALRPLLARARKLIAVAEFEAEKFSAILRLPRSRFVVIPNGSDLSTIAVEAERRTAGGRPTIISVGRLERYKGHQRVVEAMPCVLREVPGAQLRIIGSGPYQPELEQLVSRLGLADRVTIQSIPATDRKAMAQALTWGSLLVLMSEFETHPLAVIEALELGRPALVADTSGLAEIAQLGAARAISLDSTTDELAEAMLVELRDPRTIEAMSAPTWQECTDRLLALYRDVLSSAPSSAHPRAAARSQGE
jgi:glycosyltransferase involved in cell wall biosynthesis